MIDLKFIEQRLLARRKELGLLHQRHQELQKQFQNEIRSCQHAFQQLAGQIAELEQLKALLVEPRNNGEQKKIHPRKMPHGVRAS
jgi:hypothetical protein